MNPSGSDWPPTDVLRTRLSEMVGVDFGQRGGVRCGAAVYRDVLSPFAVSAPRLVGSLAHPGVEWLVLEHLEDAERLSARCDQLPTAAAWLGRFHGLSDRRLDG